MGSAWVGLCCAFALHIADEALTGFLPVYNATVRALRQRYRFLSFPTFSFRLWLTGLVLACGILFALSGFAFRGAPWIVPIATAYGAIMVGNGLLHLGASVRYRRLMPGTYSAPVLLASAIWLLVRVAERN
jgi:hypothetical protein